MKYSGNNNGDFLFGITLTELILMLFFILLLSSAFISVEKSSEIIQLHKEKERIAEENRHLQIKNRMNQKLSEEMVNSALRFKLKDYEEKDLKKEVKSIFKELSNQTVLIAENKALKAEIERYENSAELIEVNADINAEIARKAALLQELKELNSTKELHTLVSDLDIAQKKNLEFETALAAAVEKEKELLKENAFLEKSLKEHFSMTKEQLAYEQDILKGQIVYLTRKLNMGGGNELPPCWANKKSGKAEYIFSVTIGEESIKVAPKWPKYREKELKKYKGLNKLFGRDMSVDEFLKITRPIYSDADKKECKHYLYLYDDAITKDGYKMKRLRLENHFYKYEDGSKLY
ncbi:hypothetical protein [Sulfurimonas sp. HSL3-7]|uniref:hypothetical protein n=1 Tax=Sulfonitrofixus jiaomeiensis TaxID=3131938 RepID=UPI0031F902A1